ncbi:putative Peptidase A1 domain-containing protein [Seiridium unicorne]|uniref:Peptidase A1 domain-containing protein n=1 Tax=Seiridium unicorne TaxID=138068 RepID=A0ABR2UJZ1_9PEZI
MKHITGATGLVALGASVGASNVYKIPIQNRAATPAGTNVAAIDWFYRGDNEWYSIVQVGSPPQNLTVAWDTGSIDLLLPGINCTTCSNHTLFDPSKSSTYSPLPGRRTKTYYSTGVDSIPFTVPEGEGGIIVHDKIGLGDLVVESQGFILVDESAAALNKMPVDGILGLGAPNVTGIGQIPWYWNLYDSGQLASPVFAFYTPAGDINGAELTLGGIDDTKYEGEIPYTKLEDSRGGYTLRQGGLYINDKVFSKTGTAILDTGTAFMQTPDYQTAKKLYAAISPNITQIDKAGAWGAPCEEIDAIAPEFTFTFGPVGGALNVTIPKEAFNLGEYPGQPGICQALFNNPLEFVSLGGIWLIGSPLLKQYYTVWDGVNGEIGWGTLKAPASSK